MADYLSNLRETKSTNFSVAEADVNTVLNTVSFQKYLMTEISDNVLSLVRA